MLPIPPVLLAVAVSLVCCVTPAQTFSVDDYRSPGDWEVSPLRAADFPVTADKRGDWSSQACRRCVYQRDDWGSCAACYRRPGAAVPFYGGFGKRSGPDYCRCCLAAPSNSFCCSRCGNTPYYGGFGKRGGYQTSLFPTGPTGSGNCDWCCDPASLDVYCCLFQCSDKRK